MQVVYIQTSAGLKTSLVQHPQSYRAVQGFSVQAPPGLSKLKRCRVASSSELTLVDRPLKHEHHTKLKVLPRIQYRKCRFDPPGRDELLRKLEHAVANSITLVVASVLEDKLPSYQDPDKEASQASKDDWTWVTARRQRKKKKVLAGFARATGDRALTASIHDLVVLPELQGLGLGRKLLAKATNQVRNKTGITDIGLAANPGSYSFFARCAFDLDREKSIFMAFAGDSVSMTATDRLQRNTSLLQKLAETSST